MTSFVFIHGALHGAWCWQRVVAALQNAGHSAAAINLPGRDGTTQPVLSDYVRVVADAVAAAPSPVILVAHSLGGIAAGEYIATYPGAVKALVLVNALLAWDGRSALQQIQSAGEDCVFMRPGALAFSADGTTVAVNHRHAMAGFYNLCTPEDARDAAAQLCAEPIAPLSQPMDLSANAFSAVPTVYLGSREDRVLPWWLQLQIAATTSAELIELGGDHSPFLSVPGELLAELTRIQKLFT